MKKFPSIFVLLFLSYYYTQAQDIIPLPVKFVKGQDKDNFLLNSETVVEFSDTALNRSVNYLRSYLSNHYRLKIETAASKTNGRYVNKIVVTRTASVLPNQDQYTLSVAKNVIHINASTDEGIFYGVQTLIQLLPIETVDGGLAIHSAEIIDYPRFAYRGMHLDVSRHFFSIDVVKRYIDYLALHKLNYFHWHLTDDHGWRIQIKKYPKLTEIGAWRNGTIVGLYPGMGNDKKRYGGFYTQEEIKEVIKYASDRYITTIPEIEMPGHSMALLAAYPEFGTSPGKPTEVAQTWGIFNKFNNVLQPSEQTFAFMRDVLTEVIDLFPSSYIHIGGDECSKIWWKQSQVSQSIMSANGLKTETALQSYFIHKIQDFVNSKGKTIIGWDEIMDGGLAPNSVVMSWRGEQGGIKAAQLKHRVIMTPENSLYFNHAQFLKDDSLTAAKYLPLEVVYNYDPVPSILTKEQSKYIWGAQANLWTEYISNEAKVDYMFFPRIDALSELLWTPKSQKNFQSFKARLTTQFKRYDLLQIKYSNRYR